VVLVKEGLFNKRLPTLFEDDMKTIEYQNDYLALMKYMSGVTPLRVLAKERVGLFSDRPQNASSLDIQKFIDGVNELGHEIKSQLVAMDEEIDLALTALISGQIVFFLSLPGAAKTTMARMIAQGIDGKFFRKNITADTSRNDIFGPLDPEKIKQGKWGRKLSGLSTASIANIDEVFRASGPVLDMLLEALEEHTLSEPDQLHHLPLVLAITAGNDLVNANAQNAFWDRLIIRKEVSYPPRSDDWQALLRSASGTVPIQTRIDPEDIMLIQGLVELKALSLPDDVVQRMTKIREQLLRKGIEISPRRFKAWSRVIVGNAMLKGSERISSKFLMLGQHVLWIEQDDISIVRDIVGRLSDPERGILLAASADLEMITSSISNEASTLKQLLQWQAKIQKHQKLLDIKVKDPDHQSEKEILFSGFHEATAKILERSSELVQEQASVDMSA
jgi:MoxR-like ATPase